MSLAHCCPLSTWLHELLLVLSPAGPSSSQELPAEFSGTVIGPATAYCLLRHFFPSALSFWLPVLPGSLSPYSL